VLKDRGPISSVGRGHSVPSPELWVLRLTDVDATQLDLSLLDGEERQRAAHLARPVDRVSYMAAHTVLRRLLGGHLGLPPREVTYRREPCPRCGAPHGRPAVNVPDQPLHFSLSRSGGMVLIGIASVPIGVDIEMLAQPEIVNSVGALLHAAERKEIFLAAPSKRSQVFTRIWTRKEAYLKGIGMGITDDLAAEDLGGEEPTNAPQGWTVVKLPVATGYAAAVAIGRPAQSQPVVEWRQGVDRWAQTGRFVTKQQARL